MNTSLISQRKNFEGEGFPLVYQDFYQFKVFHKRIHTLNAMISKTFNDLGFFSIWIHFHIESLQS